MSADFVPVTCPSLLLPANLCPGQGYCGLDLWEHYIGNYYFSCYLPCPPPRTNSTGQGSCFIPAVPWCLPEIRPLLNTGGFASRLHLRSTDGVCFLCLANFPQQAVWLHVTHSHCCFGLHLQIYCISLSFPCAVHVGYSQIGAITNSVAMNRPIWGARMDIL